jgi:hypothetical protein
VFVRLPLLVAVLVCVLVTATAAPARTLSQNLTRVGVAPAERTEALASMARAKATAKQLGGTRGQAINAVVGSLTKMAGRAAFTPDLSRIAFLELDANTDYLATHALPSSGTRIRIDGVVYESYTGLGLRIQPLGTYFAILEPGQGIAAEGGTGAAMTSAQKIVLAVGDSNDLPYLFPYSGTQPPWYSAMAEGVAASAGISVWNRNGDDEYLDQAIRFGNSALAFGITVADNGLWFPLYVSKPNFRVLNGHLQTVLAMNDLADATGDDAFADAFNRSVAATKAVLPAYDTGGWGRYAPGQDAPVKYMSLMATQLKQLGDITGDPAFTTVGAAFAADLKTPPVLTGPTKPVKPLPLKKFKDKPFVKLLIKRDKPVKLTIRVTKKGGGPSGIGPFTVNVASGSGRIKVTLPRKAGMYAIRADAKDWAGNRVKNVLLAAVRVTR